MTDKGSGKRERERKKHSMVERGDNRFHSSSTASGSGFGLRRAELSFKTKRHQSRAAPEFIVSSSPADLHNKEKPILILFVLLSSSFSG